MHSIIEKHEARLTDLCRGFHVRRLNLFGSATGDAFDSRRSDIDFLVDFDHDSPLRALDQYFGLKDALETLLSLPVDLVMPAAVRNPYLLASIERSRVTLYAS